MFGLDSVLICVAPSPPNVADQAGSDGRVAMMNRFLALASLLFACGCGGSSSETPPPLEPDPGALPGRAVPRSSAGPKTTPQANQADQADGAESEKSDGDGSSQLEEGLPSERRGTQPAAAEPPTSTWGADGH